MPGRVPGGINTLQPYLVLGHTGIEDHDGVTVRDTHHTPGESLGVY